MSGCSNTYICYDLLPNPTVRAREWAVQQSEIQGSLLTPLEPCSWFPCWSDSRQTGSAGLCQEHSFDLVQEWEVEVRTLTWALRTHQAVSPSSLPMPTIRWAQTSTLQIHKRSPHCFCQKHLLLHLLLLFLVWQMMVLKPRRSLTIGFLGKALWH